MTGAGMPYQQPEPLTLASSRLDARVILVTGASSGIGAAAARRFAAEGAVVAVAARREDRITALAGELRQAGGEALAVRCDVTDEGSVSAAVHEVVRAFGRLDGAFNNAGIGVTHRPLHQVDAADFDRVMATNLRGPFLCMKYEIPAMLDAGGGSIVVTSSV